MPHSARVWDYWTGGHEYYAIDQAAADAYQKIYPGIADLVQVQRYFARRAIEYLAEAGIRQFLDIGPGLPAQHGNTHAIAQRVASDARTVYADNDPLVLAHARALLTGTPPGVTGYLHADLTDTHAILTGAAAHLDLDRPVALLLVSVMGHVPDLGQAHASVRRLMAGLPSGSHLVLSDATATSNALTRAQQDYNATGAAPYRLRTPPQIAGFFDGLELAEPGLVPPDRWRPGPDPFGPAGIDALCAVAMTP